MGISTYQSYCGAQIFDAVGTVERPRGEVLRRHRQHASKARVSRRSHARRDSGIRNAYGENPLYEGMLDAGGDYAFRLRGEDHAWTPDLVAKLQHAARGNTRAEFTEFTDIINDQSRRLLTLRGLMELKFAATPVPLDEVEPADRS